MDAVSVLSETWEDGKLTLELGGVPGTTETYWFHVPAGQALAAVAGGRVSVSVPPQDEIAAVDVSFEGEPVRLQMCIAP
jgi:hypothetical protein